MSEDNANWQMPPPRLPLSFEQRVEDRIERQIKLAEESNRLMERIAVALEPKPKQLYITMLLGQSIDTMTKRQDELVYDILMGKATPEQLKEFIKIRDEQRKTS
jgi:hypothetical protein